MKTIISLANLAAPDRHQRVELSSNDILRDLKERFPVSDGYVYKVEERLAQWAWPRGTKLSERELLNSIDPETRKRAFRRGIRVTKGLSWGLTMDIQTTDREMSGIELTVLRESLLSIVVAASCLVLGIVAAVGYGFKLDVYKDDYRNIVIAVFIGFAIGAVLALIGWILTRPLESLKPDQAQEIFDSTAGRITRSLLGAS